jgi:hypothetical protein
MTLTDKISDLITAQIPNPHLKNLDQQANKLLIAPLAFAWLLTMEDESLDAEDQRILEQLGVKCPDVLKARALVLECSRLRKAKEADRLNTWFDSVKRVAFVICHVLW